MCHGNGSCCWRYSLQLATGGVLKPAPRSCCLWLESIWVQWERVR